ncbi:MAG: glutaredoxin family protein [Candidatus Bathyarchaeia archaeon]
MIERVSIVLAKWCPHCVSLSLRNAKRIAEDLGVPLRVLDIDVPDQLRAADRLVEEHGDWSEDYLIPQVFLEYVDGGVGHVFTGFSEAVSVTEASWEALFSGNYYRTLTQKQLPTGRKPLREFVERYLTFEGRCRRHCDRPASYVDLGLDSEDVVGAYVCPDGYVSRVVYFSVDPDIDWFRGFLSSQVGEGIVKDRDLRIATRHGWELGDEALAETREISPEGVVREVYWTVYPKTEAERRRGVFLCSYPRGEKGCGRLFIQDIRAKSRLCPRCR